MGKEKQRPKINNYNPYNKLPLNKFHQLDKKPKDRSKSLHKKKRDLQRLLRHKQQMGQAVDQTKLKQLEQTGKNIQDKRKDFEKTKRKQYFINIKYKNIMFVEEKKVLRKLKQIKKSQDREARKEQQHQWVRKLNYIKHYPKNLKYVSLFPTNGELKPQAKAFQEKIMNDIQADLQKKHNALNTYISQNQIRQSKKPKRVKKDDFFIEEENQEEEDIPQQQE